ncbi:MAG: S-layer homology domain-containing protein [Armatimonadetes bacterium]|nr:S-layer homology domain-containing protein [Armatimonadota bacterium]
MRIVFASGLLFIWSCLAGTIWAAPFQDVPQDHWAGPAVLKLSEKGLLEGYPDGQFKGVRAASRYEMAMVVARLVAKIEQMAEQLKPPPPEVTKEDLDMIRKLVNEFKNELDALGVRVTRVEDAVSSLQSRVTELERVRISGSFDTVAVSTGLNGTRTTDDGMTWTTPANTFTFPQRDLLYRTYTSVPLQNGSAIVSQGTLEAKAKLSPETTAGVAVTGYNLVGEPTTGSVWGITPSYLHNPYTNVGNFNLKAALERAWVKHEPGNVEATVGNFYPTSSGSVLKGQPNTAYFGPDFLPFYGADVRGTLQKALGTVDLDWEIFGARLANRDPYGTVLMGTNFSTDFERGTAKLGWTRAVNEFGGPGAVGAWNTAASPGLLPAWVFDGNGALWGMAPSAGSVTAGNQKQNSWNLDFTLKLSDRIRFKGAVATSDYIPDSGRSSITGSLVSAILEGNLKLHNNLNWQVEYMSVDGKFDPFVAGYPTQVNFFPMTNFEHFVQMQFPYEVAHLGTYGLHDRKNFPNNRQGWRVKLDYEFSEYTSADLYYEALDQRDATTQQVLRQPGFSDSMFHDPALFPAFIMAATFPQPTTSGQRAQIRFFELHGSHTFSGTKGLNLDLTWSPWEIKRPGADTPGGMMGESERFERTANRWQVKATYPFTQKLKGELGYGNYDIRGYTASQRENHYYRESSVWGGVSYRLTDDATVAVKYNASNQWQQHQHTAMVDPVMSPNGRTTWDLRTTQGFLVLNLKF